MSDPYKTLAAALANNGIRCQFQTAGQMVVSRQVGPIWPNQGNSFWVTNVEGSWCLFTWAPIGYRVPATTDVAALCRVCMSVGDSAMFKVPNKIVDEFGLVELSEMDAKLIFQKMEGGA